MPAFLSTRPKLCHSSVHTFRLKSSTEYTSHPSNSSWAHMRCQEDSSSRPRCKYLTTLVVGSWIRWRGIESNLGSLSWPQYLESRSLGPTVDQSVPGRTCMSSILTLTSAVDADAAATPMLMVKSKAAIFMVLGGAICLCAVCVGVLRLVSCFGGCRVLLVC